MLAPPRMTVHLVRLDAALAELALGAPGADGVRWVLHDTLDAADAALEEAEEAIAQVVVAVDRPCSLPPDWSRLAHREGRSVRLVVLTGTLEEGDERHMLFAGATRVLRPPLPPVELGALFRDPTYLAALFPGLLQGERSERHELHLPSRPELVPPTIRFLCERLESLGYPTELVRSTMPLVIDEVLTNAMKHGNQWDPHKRVHLRAQLRAEDFELQIRDEGAGFRRQDVESPLKQENLTLEGGRGLFLMESLMDEVSYRDGGRTVVLRKRIGRRLALGSR